MIISQFNAHQNAINKNYNAHYFSFNYIIGKLIPINL